MVCCQSLAGQSLASSHLMGSHRITWGGGLGVSPSCGSPAWGDWWNQNQTSLLHICQCFPLAEGDRKPEGKGAHRGHPVCGGGLIRGPAAGWPTCLGRGECLYTQVSAWSSSPCQPAFSQHEVCWVDSWHLYLPFGARRRENWKERLWVGVSGLFQRAPAGGGRGVCGCCGWWGPCQRRGLLWAQDECLSSLVGLGQFTGHHLGCQTLTWVSACPMPGHNPWLLLAVGKARSF